MNEKKPDIIVLAGGSGKRMNSAVLPKVLIPFNKKPIITHLLDSIKETNYFNTPIIVIGNNAQLVKKILGKSYRYVYQKEQLGTGHAVLCCENMLKNKSKNIMVLYGDHPLLTSESILKIIKTHLAKKSVLTMAYVKTTDFRGWKKAFYYWGRIIRDNNGNIAEIIEYKDASHKQREIKEINPSFFCFRSDWLWKNLKNLKNTNVQKEYYLTDLAYFAKIQKMKIIGVEIKPEEALGINTVKELNSIKKFA